METNEILDQDIAIEIGDTDIDIISMNKFIVLSILSFGLYEIWWIYKSWRFFKEKDDLDINPVARTIFTFFFLHRLFEKIKTYANSSGWTSDFSIGGLVTGFIVFNFLARLPDPYWMVACASFLFLIPPFNALNFAILNSGEYRVNQRGGFNGRQIAILVLGGLLWTLVIIGLLMPAEQF